MLSSSVSRLAAFAAGLCAIGGGAAALGAATSPLPPFQDCLAVAADRAAPRADAMAGDGHGETSMIPAIPGADGRRSELAGLRLAPTSSRLATGATTTWRFRIMGCDGRPVRKFDPEQGKLLHLIVVRTDLTGYQHLHPRLGPDGTFAIDLAVARPGRYRAIADFVVGGRKYVLATTLVAPGPGADRRLPRAGLRARADGYDVELQRPAALEAGAEAQLTFRITRDGRPVRDLQPYLGAYGHLVALHAPDLAYSHVHPNSEDRRGGLITFDAELRARGPYRLFLQFRTAGRVHTAAFTQIAA
ncbi:MAG TPA: hypothetical protein VFG42_01120 [Baekduia sp.]|uniref:hypothetical protein n=1 Tax=Baekduia sp. TaxID=2600305 RepID=UPI002D77F6A3|nr:hypothetical protein [Baekduia sp.]HET6505362.1 hypothetical protein [Baekduia sp.]